MTLVKAVVAFYCALLTAVSLAFMIWYADRLERRRGRRRPLPPPNTRRVEGLRSGESFRVYTRPPHSER